MPPMRIVIDGPATAFRGEPEEAITDPEALRALDGVFYDADVCSRYHEGKLADLAMAGGGLRIRFDAESRTLRVVTEFDSPRELKPKELEALVEDTQAQWSDGIGEGCFDDYCQQTGIRIDPAAFLHKPRDQQDVRAEQIAGVAKAPPKPSPLFASAKSGNVKRIRKLLADGENPNVLNKDDYSPLHLAVMSAHNEAAQALLEGGANPNLHEIDGFSALTWATIKGNLEMVHYLLDHGADVNGRTIAGENVHYPPLVMACNRRQFEAGKILLDYNPDVNLSGPGSYPPLLMLDETGVDFARLLLERGADINARSHSGGINPKLRELLG